MREKSARTKARETACITHTPTPQPERRHINQWCGARRLRVVMHVSLCCRPNRRRTGCERCGAWLVTHVEGMREGIVRGGQRRYGCVVALLSPLSCATFGGAGRGEGRGRHALAMNTSQAKPTKRLEEELGRAHTQLGGEQHQPQQTREGGEEVESPRPTKNPRDSDRHLETQKREKERSSGKNYHTFASSHKGHCIAWHSHHRTRGHCLGALGFRLV